ncbi:MAG: CHAT domain-containing protein [Deltaproteobacteria bacterium]|nr:CHAT domain-containing protein [Deltaproteobacteria bacterium]MBM4284623.1 CHAT domain-containing protein [Deltaproteobacteria bacterium]
MARKTFIVILLLMLKAVCLPAIGGVAHAQTTALEEAESLNQKAMKLYAAGRYQEALPLSQRALQIYEKRKGHEHPHTAAALNNLAQLYHAMRAYDQALPLYRRALLICEKALGADHLETAHPLNSLGRLYDDMGAYEKALPLLRRALAIREKVLGPEHPDTTTSLNNLGELYKAMGAYEKALPLLRHALAIKEKVLGPEDPGIATSLNNLAGLYKAMGAYEKALPLLRRALAIREKVLGLEHPDTATSLNNLGLLYKEMGAYEKALPHYRRALAIKEKVLGPEDPGIATSLNNLAGLYKAMGVYEKALPLLLRALAIKEKVLGPEHPDTATSLNNLAVLYEAMGAYEKALPLYRRALAIREKVLGPEHPDTANSLDNLAGLYNDMGAYDQALPLYRRALAIKEKVLGPEHPGTALSLSNLAMLYQEMGYYDQALPLHRRALAIREKALGQDHPHTALSLNNFGGFYNCIGAYDQALPLYRRALSIREKFLGSEHSHTIGTLNNLACLHLSRQEYQEAEALFQRSNSKVGLVALYLATGRFQAALELLEKIQPSWRAVPGYQVQFATQQGQALAGVGRRGEAAAQLFAATQGIENLRRRVTGPRTGFFQVKEHRLAYLWLTAVLGDMSIRGEPLPPALEKFGPQTGAAAFYFAEATKGRVLLEEMAAAAARGGLGQIPPDLAQKEQGLLDRLGALEANWEKHYTQGEEVVANFRKQREELQKQLDALVAELRQKYPRYAALKYPRPLKPQEIPLKPQEVLLEYALGEKSCYLFRVEPGGRTQVYAIPLGQEELGKLVNDFIAPLQSQHTCQDFNPAQGRKLYEMLLAPALKDLAPEKRLIIVPDGILGLLPFEALVVQAGKDAGDTRFVGDERLLTYSQSAAILALNRVLAASQAKKPLFALGNPIYSDHDPRYLAHKAGKPAPVLTAQAAPQYAFRALATRREWGKTTSDDKQGKELSYPPLGETENEVRAIAGLFGVKPEPPDILLNLAASETRLRQAPLQTYRYLHFATHGDLAGKVQGINEPFILLGQVENQDQDNGFLTLSKVLGLKLDADMVVLSACLTGRGKVMEGEGVAHLARAFQQAGARSVVVSLWEVADAPAVEYMVTFYTHLKAGKGRAEALRLARQHMKTKYPNPYHWAPFILHGEG